MCDRCLIFRYYSKQKLTDMSANDSAPMSVSFLLVLLRFLRPLLPLRSLWRKCTFRLLALQLREFSFHLDDQYLQLLLALLAGVVREFVGHGIGKEMHEDPQVPNYGKRGYGPLMKRGLCIAIEPMITLGDRQVIMERDGWTVRTRDRKCAAHFEHTIAVGAGEADILSSFKFIEEVLGDKAI